PLGEGRCMVTGDGVDAGAVTGALTHREGQGPADPGECGEHRDPVPDRSDLRSVVVVPVDADLLHADTERARQRADLDVPRETVFATEGQDLPPHFEARGLCSALRVDDARDERELHAAVVELSEQLARRGLVTRDARS